MAWDRYYTAKSVRCENALGRAFVMHGQKQGVFVALTIRVSGSAWFCRPAKDGDEWAYRSATTKAPRTKPPRWVRKEAKLALRRFLNP